MTREEEIQAESHRALDEESIPDNNYIAFEKGFCIGAKWATKEFADRVKRVCVQYKYNPNVTMRFQLVKEMIYDKLFMHLIEMMKRDGFIEIKETQEDNESTIFMCVNVLKNDFKKTT